MKSKFKLSERLNRRQSDDMIDRYKSIFIAKIIGVPFARENS